MFIEKLSYQPNDLHTNYDNILLLGDFNMTPEDLKMQDFCDNHDLENIIKEPTCFKGKNLEKQELSLRVYRISVPLLLVL